MADWKKEAEKKAEKLGHELKAWKYEPFGGRKRHHTYCRLCREYVVIEKDNSIWGTAIDTHPVRDFNIPCRIKQVRYRCWGVKDRAKERWKYTLEKKRILKAFNAGGINQVINTMLGDYPK